MSRLLRVFLPVLWIAAFVATAQAAVPSSGELTEVSGPLGYIGGPYTAVNPSNNVGDEPDCGLVPNSCDDYMLTVTLPPGYDIANPTHVVTIKIQWPNTANDFDVYVQDPSTGLSEGRVSATSADPEVVIVPAISAVYRIRTLVFAAANESFSGTITLGALDEEPIGTGTYAGSSDVFTCNLHLIGSGPVFGHGQDGEPAVKITKDGVAWFGAIAGVPAGNGVWSVTDPCGQAATFHNLTDFSAGGGDIDVEIAPERNPLGNYNIYMSSLWLGNITSVTSVDNGATWAPVVVSDPVPVNDRQWNAAYGALTLYLSWRSLNTGNQLFCARSDNGGVTFGAPVPVYDDVVATTLATQLGAMVCDTRPVPAGTLPFTAGPDGQANVYHGYILTVPAGNQIYVAKSTDFGISWVSRLVFTGAPGQTFDHVFSWVAVDAAGNVYTTWSSDHDVFYSFSINQGDNWSRPVRVNGSSVTKTSIFPMVEAGSEGRIVFGWYGSSADNSQDTDAEWYFFHTRCNNALDAVPHFELTRPSDHVVHSGQVCQDGLNCSCCRELLELAEIAINPVDGATSITTGSSGAQGTYISRQVAGQSAYANLTVPDNSACCRATPTVIARFLANDQGNSVELVWSAHGDGDVVAWDVYRAREGGAFQRINTTPIPMVGGGEFRFVDDAAPAGALTYRLSGISATGTELLVATTTLVRDVPSSALTLALAGANPFRGATQIAYTLPVRTPVRVEVFSVGGQRLRTLVDRVEEAGSHSATFRLQEGGRTLGPGVYMVKLTAGAVTRAMQVVAVE